MKVKAGSNMRLNFQPPTANMSMGSGGMGQSGGHAPSNLSDSMAPGLPPTSMMQSQMNNGESSSQMLQINSRSYQHHFSAQTQKCVHMSSSTLLSVLCLEHLSDPDFAACLSADTIPCPVCRSASLIVVLPASYIQLIVP